MICDAPPERPPPAVEVPATTAFSAAATRYPPDFIRLHSRYWHYDILFALKVMAEAGFIQDEGVRCA
jgi:hypothetical protein